MYPVEWIYCILMMDDSGNACLIDAPLENYVTVRGKEDI